VMLAGYDAASDRCAVGEYGECLVRELPGAQRDAPLQFERVVFKPKSLLGWFSLPDAARRSSIVHIQYPYEGWGSSPFPGALGVVAKRGWPLAKTKVVTTFHEWRSMHWLRKLSILPLAYWSDMLVFVSKRERDAYCQSLVGRLRGRRQRVEVIPIGVNLHVPVIDRGRVLEARRQILGDEQVRRGVIIGFFGFVYGWKQPEKLLDAIGEMQRNGLNAKLLICGDFPDGHETQRKLFWDSVRERGLGDHVVHKGYVEDEVVLAHLLAACDAHLYLYKDGVSSRRGSFWYSLELGSTIICSPPEYPGEFDGLIDLEKLCRSGAVRFVDADVTGGELARVIAESPQFDVPGHSTARAPSWRSIAAWHCRAYRDLLGAARPHV
jgi:glycosyltransferase involved in cell wall biosynthesis